VSLFMSTKSLADLYQEIIEKIDPYHSRKGLEKTPLRAEKAILEMTSGYHESIDESIENALYPAPSSELVTVKNIDFFSLCEHHLLPFYGHVHIGYIPNHQIIGLSKIPRIVEHYAKRLQLQEQLTSQIAKALLKYTNAQGVAVISVASHLCMQMRGIKKKSAQMQCSSYLGVFKNAEMKQEFLTNLLI
jgi:GTP cyclohydrolase I